MKARIGVMGAALVLLAVAPAFGQSSKWTPPKTAWGDPDLQGLWPASANIPMQRAANLGDKAELTEAELKQREERAAQQDAADSEEFAPTAGGVTINPPSYWVERADPHKQTSMVVDPPDGRIPPLTKRASDFSQSLRGGLGPGSHFPDKVDSPEDFDYYSRCITRGPVSSLLPTLYNFGNRIVQGPGYVVIMSEMIHEARVIPINAGAHVGSDVKMYMGDSRGHWEGNTLVVETTNFNPMTAVNGGYLSDKAKLIEHFTRTGPKELLYEATIDDPETWTKPWSIRYPYTMDPEYPLYEYACHEGNYMMLDSLMGARMREKEGLSTKVDRGAEGGPPPGQR